LISFLIFVGRIYAIDDVAASELRFVVRRADWLADAVGRFVTGPPSPPTMPLPVMLR